MVLRERKLSEYLFYWLNIADTIKIRRIAMAELRIHDQSSTFYKSLRSRGTDVNVDLNLPDRSGIILTEKELMDILNRESKLNADAIMKPDITETPIDANGFAGPIPIATYKTSETFLGEHDKTEWIASDTEDFHRITDGSSNKIFKTSWYPNLTTSGEQVYVKYRFRSGNIVSPWSDTIAFRGTAQGIITPSITVEENGLEPAIKITPLAYYGTFPGIEHVSTSWVIEDEEGNKVVERPLDTVNKVKLVIEADVLDPKKEYTIYATQHTNVAQPAWAKSKTAIGEYITPKSKVDRPVLRYDDSGDPKVIGSAFSGEGAHLATEWMIYNDLGAKIAEFSYDTIKLTTFPMKDFVSQGRKYRITARYITAESKSPRGSVSIEIPAPSAGDISTVSGMNINATTENRGMSISVVPFVSPVREDIQYWRYQVRLDISHGSPVTNVHYIHSETDTSQEVEDSWNEALRKDLTPAQSWLAWFPNSDIVNPTISISGTSVRMGLKTEVRNRAQAQSKTFDYVLGNATWEDTNTLNPLIKISDSTGADVAWMGYRGTEWTLSKKTGSTPEGNPIWTKVRVENSTDKSKHRLNALETDTEYRVTVVHKTNCFCFAKDYEFRSAAYIMASPVVAMEGSGKKWKIKSSGYSLTNYTGPNGQHGSTSYLVTKKNTGEKVWESLKDTVNKTVANIPESVLELGQEYNVRVIFHSAAGHDSGANTVSFKVPTYVATHSGTVSMLGNTEVLPKGTLFKIQNFKVTNLETSTVVTTELLSKVTWILEKYENGTWVRVDGVEKYSGANNNPTEWISNAALPIDKINIRLKTICYSTNGIVSDEVITSYSIFDKYIETCDDKWTMIYGDWENGGILGFVPPECTYSAFLMSDDLKVPLRKYTGEWGLASNRRKNNLDPDNPTNHYGWVAGQRVSYKGKLYEALAGQRWNEFNPETVTEKWKLIEKDLKIPSPNEVIDSLGFGNNDHDVTIYDASGYDTTLNYITSAPSLPTITDMEARETKEWFKFFSPTEKRIGFTTDRPLTFNIKWANIITQHPEIITENGITARYGTRLYKIRLLTLDEMAIFINYSFKLSPHAPYTLELDNLVPICQVIEKNSNKIKVVQRAVSPLINEKTVDSTTMLSLRVVIFPLKEEEAPYQRSQLIKNYPNFPNLATNYGQTGLYENDIMVYNTLNKVTGEDTNWHPGGLDLIYDPFTDTGYFGRIKQNKFVSIGNLESYYSINKDRNVNSEKIWYDIIYYHGNIYFIPNQNIFSKLTFLDLLQKGLVYGTNVSDQHYYPGDIKLKNWKEEDKYSRLQIMAPTMNKFSFTPFPARGGSCIFYNNLFKNGISLHSDTHWSVLMRIPAEMSRRNLRNMLGHTTQSSTGAARNNAILSSIPYNINGQSDDNVNSFHYFGAEALGHSFDTEEKLKYQDDDTTKSLYMFGRQNIVDGSDRFKYLSKSIYGDFGANGKITVTNPNAHEAVEFSQTSKDDTTVVFRPVFRILQEKSYSNLLIGQDDNRNCCMVLLAEERDGSNVTVKIYVLFPDKQFYVKNIRIVSMLGRVFSGAKGPNLIRSVKNNAVHYCLTLPYETSIFTKFKTIEIELEAPYKAILVVTDSTGDMQNGVNNFMPAHGTFNSIKGHVYFTYLSWDKYRHFNYYKTSNGGFTNPYVSRMVSDGVMPIIGSIMSLSYGREDGELANCLYYRYGADEYCTFLNNSYAPNYSDIVNTRLYLHPYISNDGLHTPDMNKIKRIYEL